MVPGVYSFSEISKRAPGYLEPFRSIQQNRQIEERFLAESELVLSRALKSNWAVQAILGTPNRIARLSSVARPSECVFIEISQQELNEWVGFDLHRGCVGSIAIPRRSDPKGIVPAKIVVAERHCDPSNIGTLLRNSRALGADLVVIDSKGATPFSRKVARASAGHIFNQPFIVEDARHFVHRLYSEGSHQILGASLSPSSISISDFTPTLPWALCLGNEGDGLTKNIIEKCHHEIKIPMQNNVDSLNVAAATAVLLYALANSA